MNPKKYLIVNADDFGLSPGINRGVIGSHERGIVTSASLMVRWPAAAEAAAYAREHRSLSLGLHVDIGEWAYRDDEWVPAYSVVSTEDVSGLESEITRQLETFSTLSGMVPTHIDSHQHVHRRDPVRSLLTRFADALRIPLRQCSPSIIYCGNFYGQTTEGMSLRDNISVSGLMRTLMALKPGITELSCHPAATADFVSAYRTERQLEFETLCDPQVRRQIDIMGIELLTFGDTASTIQALHQSESDVWQETSNIRR
jgi:chitin disaccharide deacetylase